MIKKILKGLVAGVAHQLPLTKVGRYFQDEMIHVAMEANGAVTHNGCDLLFSVPNSLNRFRFESFSTKEPETLEWIDEMAEGSVLWDIGANVGLYSCYAAKKKGCRVYAFEPSVFNLELLARNIFINGLVDRVTIVPIPLSNTLQINTMNMTSTEWGGALSTFGQMYGDDGKTMNKVFEFSTIGVSMDGIGEALGVPMPHYIKMDVDGIEHLLLEGGIKVIEQVRGLIIEVNEDFGEQADNVQRYLTDAGLVFKEKRNSMMFENNERFGHCYNQIWNRP